MLHMYAFITAHLTGLQTKRDERGATAVEYGLMVALIAVFIIGAVRFLATELDGLFRLVGGAL